MDGWEQADPIQQGWCPIGIVSMFTLVLLVSGCAGYRIDPSGEHIFIPAESTGAVPPASSAAPVYDPGPYRDVPSGPSPCSEIVVTPQEMAAPVGTEVVLIASVRGQDAYMRTNQRVEWTIPPESVGEFVDFSEATFTDYLVGDFTRPRKVTDRFVITSSVRRYLRLTRGTPSPNDDVYVRPGQAWISVTSPIEGTSVVSAYAPCVNDWQRRVQTAVIHWVDAEWQFPSPAIVSAGGRETLVTTVTRRRDGSPCTGWRVRYEIAGGAPAALGTDGTQVVEVPVDESGQAAVDIYQNQPAGGTTQIRVQIIRPGEVAGAAGKRLVISSGTALVTWSAPQLNVRVSGPTAAGKGSTGTYTIEVSNPGDLPADNVVLTHQLGEGAQLQSSNPQATDTGSQLQWQVGRLGARETRTYQVTYLYEATGSFSCCAQATADAGLSAEHCTTTSVGVASLSMTIQGPQEAVVGDEVSYVIELTNRGQAAATNVIVRDTFERGLQHAVAQGGVERAIPGGVAPGETKRIGVTFRVVESGRWCHTVNVTADGQSPISQQACVTVRERETPPPPHPAPSVPGDTGSPPPETAPGTLPPTEGSPLPPAEQPAPPDTQPPEPTPPSDSQPRSADQSISLEVEGPAQVQLGDSVHYEFQLVNVSQDDLQDVQVFVEHDPSLETLRGSEGFRYVGERLQYDLPTLEPNKGAKLHLYFRATEVRAQACVQVEVVLPDGGRVQRQRCTAVEPTSLPGTSRTEPADGGALALQILDRHDPIRVGRSKTVVFRVNNSGAASHREVTLEVETTPQLRIDRLQTRGPAGLDARSTETVARFRPLDALPPGQSLEYQVALVAQQPGSAAITGRVSSRSLAEPVISERETLVVAQ